MMNELHIQPWRITAQGAVTEFTQSIFSIGNGFLGLRGFSLQQPKGLLHDHAMFRAGLYEYIKPGITDLVQLPDVLGLRLTGHQEENVRHELDLRTGVYTQSWQDSHVQVTAQRMASMADPQLICVRLTLTAQRGCDVQMESVVDDRVANLPIHDDQMVTDRESVRLLETVRHQGNELVMQTVHSHRRVRFLITLMGRMQAHLEAGESLTVEKRVRVLVDEESPRAEAADPWAENEDAWAALWRDCDIQLEGDEGIQGGIRYNIFQLLCANAAGDAGVSIGARGITHGRYKGNAFWDTDIFLFPFFCWQRPKAAQALARFRLNGLDAARALAKKQNLAGARYPWMCATDGKEQCESWDIGLCETHITADVPYALWRYQTITGDESLDFSELYAETARYWRSRFTWEEAKQQYSTFFVKGPDEYCGAAVNNTYTNYLARHNVRLALANSRLSEEERRDLEHFAQHIAILYDEERQLFLQDELFERLEPLPRQREAGEPLYRTICFDRMQRYRALKQADLVQLMTLLPNDFTLAQKRAVWEMYEPLTVHDSSLSFGAHALLGFRLGLMEEAWRYFARSLMLDLRDELHHEGNEGLHMAAMGVSWQAVVYGMLGLWAEGDTLTVEPRLPQQIKRLSLCVYHRGRRLRITADAAGAVMEEEA